MRRRRDVRDSGAPEWSPARLLAALVVSAVVALALLAGLVLAVVEGLKEEPDERDDARQAALADAVTALVIAALALVRVVPEEAARGLDTAVALVREGRRTAGSQSVAVR